MRQEPDIQPCLIRIDKEGCWFHKGVEMIRRDIIRLFYEHLTMDPAGRYILEWAGDRCEVEVEDTAYVVRQVSTRDPDKGGSCGYRLLLSDDTWETLEPDTLSVGKGHVLYCRVKKTFPAGFTRPAYYQLAAHIEEESGRYYLPWEGKRTPILCGGPENHPLTNRISPPRPAEKSRP